MYTLGIDLGSSSVKVSILELESGICVSSASSPEKEMVISAPKPGWAEQHPEMWWENVKLAIGKALQSGAIEGKEIKAIGIAYQMHGLVAVDKNQQPVRPAIIWCDSRAVDIGDRIFRQIGEEKCLSCLLNSPANFTFSKLVWIKENEPALFEKIDKIMLPGDYIALKLTGEAKTTVTGLSEGILWDFKADDLAHFLPEAIGIDPNLISGLVPTFGVQGYLSVKIAQELGLSAGIPISYRAGDQPNNAFSLNVLNPGEIAATAGTSGVVYGVTDRVKYDPELRINTFAHVNHLPDNPRYGMLLCINGAGISNSWIKKITNSAGFEQMNQLAKAVAPGSEGLLFIPFGNGAERMLSNRQPGAGFINIDFNLHSQAHLYRAVQEGVAFAFKYGIEIMQQTGIRTKVIRAGHANMFLSDVFCQTVSNLTGAKIQLYNTDGSMGAARGAALGAGFYQKPEQCFINLSMINMFQPQKELQNHHENLYENWKFHLKLKTS